MKKLLLALLILLFVFLIVSFFIPVDSQKRLSIANTYTNVVYDLNQPAGWLRSDSSIIHITRLSYLSYRIEHTEKDNTTGFNLSVIPFSGPPGSKPSSPILYTYRTNLFYKLFPFMEKPGFAQTTVSRLKSFLEDNI
ncbi:MAG TPA: hypothetical protein VNU70_07920 [Puia sp.]|jgi:hypothetical protein|nr:hypothetical protein [Puia sp.]